MLALSEKSRSIRDAAVAFATEMAIRDICHKEAATPIAVEVMREAAARGLAGWGLAEDAGGTGLTSLDAVLVFEALAQDSPSLAADLSIHNTVARLVDRHGSPAQRGAWLPKLASMDWVAGVGAIGPALGGDLAPLVARAQRDGDHYVVVGKQLSLGAPAQNACVAMMSTGDEGQRAVSAFLVERGLPSLTFADHEQEGRRETSITFQGCLVPTANRIGAEGDGTAVVETVLDGARLNIAACSLGGAAGALKDVLAWLGRRTADTPRLDETQAFQFRLAEMAIELEAARTFLWRTACALESNEANVSTLCAIAKRFAGDVGLKIANAALELRDAYRGHTDHRLEEIARDLRAHRNVYGTSDGMRTAIARDLLGDPQ